MNKLFKKHIYGNSYSHDTNLDWKIKKKTSLVKFMEIGR
jgi:hypothetical protein